MNHFSRESNNGRLHRRGGYSRPLALFIGVSLIAALAILIALATRQPAPANENPLPAPVATSTISVPQGGTSTTSVPGEASSTSVLPVQATTTKPTPPAATATIPKPPAATTTVVKPAVTSTTPVSVRVVSASSASAAKFGISFGDSLPGLSNEDLAFRLNDLVAIGLGWMRFDISWSDVQPTTSTSYQWGNLDRVVAAANARHIRLLPVIGYTPKWARPSNCQDSNKCAPANVEQFAIFVRAAALRYGSQGIREWEIWNEPNLVGFWKPQPDVARYAALLKAASTAIKSAVPGAFIITGGTGPTATTNGDINPVEFLQDLYFQGAQGHFDAVGFHPYSFPAMPSYYQSWNAWSQMSQTNPSLRSVMALAGDSVKPIWMTEYGAPTGGPGIFEQSTTDTKFAGSPHKVTEDVQAKMLSDAVRLAKGYSWAGPLFWYSYQDIGTTQDTAENFFGLIRYDGVEKPAYDTLTGLMK
jgi:polysaccharide biosynthesis protein PslG